MCRNGPTTFNVGPMPMTCPSATGLSLLLHELENMDWSMISDLIRRRVRNNFSKFLCKGF